MLGLLLIYFIGKNFFDLAGKYNKHQWGYAIVGIAAYYFGIFLGAILIGIGIELWGAISIDNVNETLFGIMSIPFGILACYGLYKLLDRYWKHKPTQLNPDILDEELPE